MKNSMRVTWKRVENWKCHTNNISSADEFVIVQKVLISKSTYFIRSAFNFVGFRLFATISIRCWSKTIFSATSSLVSIIISRFARLFRCFPQSFTTVKALMCLTQLYFYVVWIYEMFKQAETYFFTYDCHICTVRL